jgi:hypothetical protein
VLVGIAGHALWNGSTVVLDGWLSNASDLTYLLVTFGWILFLVVLVLQAGRRLFAAALSDSYMATGPV